MKLFIMELFLMVNYIIIMGHGNFCGLAAPVGWNGIDSVVPPFPDLLFGVPLRLVDALDKHLVQRAVGHQDGLGFLGLMKNPLYSIRLLDRMVVKEQLPVLGKIDQ